jgi:hypothetical protein
VPRWCGLRQRLRNLLRLLPFVLAHQVHEVSGFITVVFELCFSFKYCVAGAPCLLQDCSQSEVDRAAEPKWSGTCSIPLCASNDAPAPPSPRRAAAGEGSADSALLMHGVAQQQQQKQQAAAAAAATRNQQQQQGSSSSKLRAADDVGQQQRRTQLLQIAKGAGLAPLKARKALQTLILFVTKTKSALHTNTSIPDGPNFAAASQCSR